jgi:hypothetical protein
LVFPAVSSFQVFQPKLCILFQCPHVYDMLHAHLIPLLFYHPNNIW